MNIKNKSLEDQKRIIQTYVQNVIVYEDTIDIHLIVDMYGGGEARPLKSTTFVVLIIKI